METIFNTIGIIQQDKKIIEFVVYNDDNRIIKRYQLDDNNNLESDIKYDEKGNIILEKINSLVNTFKYDENNRVIEKNCGGFREKYEYDKYNNIKLIIRDDKVFHIINLYDNNGNLIEKCDSTNNTINKYEYNDNNLLIKQIIIDKHNTTDRTTISNKYDIKNRLIKTICNMDKISDSDIKTITNYRYNDKDKIIYEENITIINGNTKYNISEWIYNSNDILIEEKYYTKNNIDISGKTIDDVYYHYKYNNERLCVYANDNNIIKKYNYSNDYHYIINLNDNDLIIEKLYDEKGKVYFTKFKNGKIRINF